MQKYVPIETTGDPGDHSEVTACEPVAISSPKLTRCTTAPYDKFAYQRPPRAYKNHMRRAQQFACFQLHSKVNCTAAKRYYDQIERTKIGGQGMDIRPICSKKKILAGIREALTKRSTAAITSSSVWDGVASTMGAAVAMTIDGVEVIKV